MTHQRPRRPRWLVMAGLAALMLVVMGCDGEPQATAPTPEATLDAATPTPEDTPEAIASPTPSPTAVPEPFGEPPPPPSLAALVGDDYDAVVRTHEAFRRWLYRYNPDPDQLEEIYHPECPCVEAEGQLLAHYRDHDLRWTGGELEIEDVEIVDDQGTRGVVLRVVTVRSEPSYLVDADGEVHDELEPRTRTEELVFVREHEEAAWLLRSFGEVDTD